MVSAAWTVFYVSASAIWCDRSRRGSSLRWRWTSSVLAFCKEPGLEVDESQTYIYLTSLFGQREPAPMQNVLEKKIVFDVLFLKTL